MAVSMRGKSPCMVDNEPRDQSSNVVAKDQSSQSFVHETSILEEQTFGHRETATKHMVNQKLPHNISFRSLLCLWQAPACLFLAHYLIPSIENVVHHPFFVSKRGIESIKNQYLLSFTYLTVFWCHVKHYLWQVFLALTGFLASQERGCSTHRHSQGNSWWIEKVVHQGALTNCFLYL